MADRIIEGLFGIVALVLGISALSALISKNATTVPLVGALSSGLATDIFAATSPVTGYTGSGGGQTNPQMPAYSTQLGGG